MTCLSIIRLVPQPAGRIVGGQILFEGANLLAKSEVEMRQIRGRKISIILQDPMTSLNPVFTIGHQLMEPLRIHQGLSGRWLCCGTSRSTCCGQCASRPQRHG
jgi:ABC-type dipeptide/oligopeptide/nickel transport system ATPase component